MQSTRKNLIVITGILLLVFCLCGTGTLFMVYLYPAVSRTAVPPLIFSTRVAAGETSPAQSAATEIVPPGSTSGPQGKIVFVCQLFRLQASDQLCVINADGTNWHRLTTDDKIRSFYPSFAPDGNSVVFSSNSDGNFKLYEISLSGQISPLGNTVGIAPEVSPDNQFVAYVSNSGEKDNVWVMDRDGSHSRLLFMDAWDPTWTPDGSRILFATHIKGKPQLATVKLDGSDFRQMTDLPFLRGRSDWSPDGAHVVTYSGESWKRELFLMDADGANLHEITKGGNSQGPSFSPDGQWVAFTAYFDAMNNNNGCEIYIMRIDGSDLTRITNNTYCDWQPRWGP